MSNVKNQRDTELENIVGNLLIAEYQVEKLRDRVVDKVGGRYTRLVDKKQSIHVFKSNDSWIKVSINVEKIATEKAHDIHDEIQENDYPDV
jgi:hypothetical protein